MRSVCRALTDRAWQDTTIRGQKDRGTGILNNELYVGQLVWNRCSYVKDPRTGKRVARPNPPERWERTEVPDLRIIDDDLWHEVKRRQETTAFEMGRDESGNALNRAHRRRFLLSGLLVCGCCGGGYTIMAKDRYGCAGRRSKGTCANDRTIIRPEIEDADPQGPEAEPAHAGAGGGVHPRLPGGGEPADEGGERQSCGDRGEARGRSAQDRRHPEGDRGRVVPAIDEGAYGGARSREGEPASAQQASASALRRISRCTRTSRPSTAGRSRSWRRF